MQDQEANDPGFVSPWFIKEPKPAEEFDYFPNDYPIDEKLVTPPEQEENRNN